MNPVPKFLNFLSSPFSLIGRTEERKAVMTQLFESTIHKKNSTPFSLIVIRGERGVGKTALAKSLYWEDKNFFNGAFLFDCSTEESLYRSCSSLIFSDKSQSYVHPRELNDCLIRIDQLIRRNPHVLFIFDNVTRENVEKIRHLIPRPLPNYFVPNLSVVITTTEENLKVLDEKQITIELSVLSPDEALILIQKRLMSSQDLSLYDEGAAKKLSHSVGYNPQKICDIINFCCEHRKNLKDIRSEDLAQLLKNNSEVIDPNRNN